MYNVTLLKFNTTLFLVINDISNTQPIIITINNASTKDTLQKLWVLFFSYPRKLLKITDISHVASALVALEVRVGASFMKKIPSPL